ncbi:MAG: hypothetical protein FVQ77_03700 [Cytophagales bacterium]|nr:hypothetical protein [Cytophagales bacterium]
MKNKSIQVILIDKVKKVLAKLRKSETGTLSRSNITEILGKDFEPYYSYIVSAIAHIGKITKRSGRTGGIEWRYVQGIQGDLVQDNIKKLERYFKELDLEQPQPNRKILKQERANELEKDIYPALKAYLEDTGMFDLVEIKGDKRAGRKWENMDIICVKYNKLIYHFGIYPKLTAVEVKREFPNITHIQQAASYLRFCNSSYLCYYDSYYKGKNVDEHLTKLRDLEIWDISNVFNIGLIVAYKAKERAQKFRFQLIKEAPDITTDPTAIEAGIKEFLSDKAKTQLKQVLNEQLSDRMKLR